MDLKYLELAFKYAKKAFDSDEVPVGAVIVKDGNVLSYGYNTKEKNQSVLSHAELNAIKKAENKIGNWRLDNCDLYVTLDPCPMCASAIKQSRIRNVYSAIANSDVNNEIIIKKIFEKDNINPGVSFCTNLDVSKGKSLLNDFFKRKRL